MQPPHGRHQRLAAMTVVTYYGCRKAKPDQKFPLGGTTVKSLTMRTTLDPPDYDAATERMRQIVERRLKGAPAKSDRYSIHMAQEARVEIGTIPQNA